MKKVFLFLTAFVFVSPFAEAKIWRVNNNAGITADFTTAQAAHDAGAVANGDTLYFEHSAGNYGDLVMSKRLVLIGTGDFLHINLGSQYVLSTSSLNNIRIRPSAANSIISVSNATIKDSASGVLITRCWTQQIEFYWSANCSVSNCFVAGAIAFYMKIGPGGYGYVGCTGMTVNNNLVTNTIQQDAYYYQNIPCSGCTPGWVIPHSINAYNNSALGAISVTGAIYNNICSTMGTDATTSVTNNVFYFALATTNRTIITNNNPVLVPFEGGNNNQFSLTTASLYVGGTQDTSFRLKPAALAIGAGTNGVDCGATGGSTPYVFAVQPAIPAIYKLSAAAASSGNTIGVTVSTRSNN